MDIKQKKSFRYSEKRQNNIKDFFSVGAKSLPKEFSEDFLNTKLNIHYEDLGNFLDHSGGLNRFVELSVILNRLEKDISKVELFEAGANTKPRDKYFFNQNIPYFMANSPEKYNYFGFEPENTFTESDLDEVFSEKEEEMKYDDTMEIIDKKSFKSNLERNLTNDYETFKNKISQSQKPVIFSNFVLGCPNIQYDSDFWNLPGLHVDQFLEGDLVSYREGESLEEKNNRIKKVLNGVYDFSTNEINFVDGFENKIIYYEV